MNAQNWPKLKALALVAGVMVLLSSDGMAAAPPGNAATGDAAGGSTNSIVATNASAHAGAPLAKVPPVIPTSPGLAEIVKMAQSGIGVDVLLAYIESSNIAYNPTAEELVYLHDVGIPARVVTAMIEHGKKLRAEGEAATLAAAGALSGNAPPSSAAAETPPPSEAVPSESAPAYAPGQSPSYNVPAPASAPEAATLPPQVNYFYNGLTPYGTWYDVPDYGWCWQPTVAVVEPAWRPYCDGGRWLDSDSGWYWSSDYSWGWGPFHYGRWCRYGGLGWLWVPGSVWGPAWVSWRASPLYCGWAPLPPAAVYGVGGFTYFGAGVGVGFGFGLVAADYTFLPVRHFCDWNPYPFLVGPTLVVNVFNQTTVHNNYRPGPDGRIMNLGVDPGRVAAAGRSELTKVAIRDLTPAAGKLVKPDRLERDGSQLVVYRPQALNAMPPRPSTAMTFVRRELPSPSAAAAAARPTAGAPERRAPLRVASGPLTPNLIPVVRLADTASRPAASTVSPPPLGHYPTERWAGRPDEGAVHPAGTDGASLPLPLAATEEAGSRHELRKPLSGEWRSEPRAAGPQLRPTTTMRPSFYNPPPVTWPERSSSRGVRTFRSSPETTLRTPSFAPRESPPSAYLRNEESRPARGWSYTPQPSRVPSAPARIYSPPRFERPIYSAPPRIESRPAYVPRSQSFYTPSYPSYQPIRSYGALGSAGRSYGGRSFYSAPRPAAAPSSPSPSRRDR